MTSTTQRINLNTVKSLKPGDTVWDLSPVGFGVRCQKSAKTYCLKYRVHGRQRWLTIGRHGSPWTPVTARQEAERLLGMVATGVDPADQREAGRNAPTMSKALEMFMAEHVRKRGKDRTVAEYQRLVEKELSPALGRRRVVDVTPADIARLHGKLRETPYQANRCLAVLSKFFNWAEQAGLRPHFSNPCRHIEKYKEAKRERMLSPDELRRLGEALAAFEPRSPYAVAAIRLLLFTGARLNEVLTLRWDYVDTARGEARLPDSKTGAKTLHLPPPALEVLEALPKVEGNPHVIVGYREGAHLINIAKPWQAIRKAAGLDNLRIHDLRHAFASVAASGGMSLPIIGKMLGHSQPQTTARYAHLADDPVKAASTEVAGLIEAAMRSSAERSGD